jgi:hypothetical protein
MRNNALSPIKSKSLVTVGDTPLVIGRRVVGETCQMSPNPVIVLSGRTYKQLD